MPQNKESQISFLERQTIFMGRHTHLFIIALLLFFSLEANGQTEATIPQQITRGVVVDRHTRQPIADVAITDDEKEIGRTDENGRFAIRLRSDSVTFSHISYTSLKVGKGEMIDTIPLTEQTNELGNVYIIVRHQKEFFTPHIDPLAMQTMPQGFNIGCLIVKGLKALGIIPKRNKHQSRLQKAQILTDNY